MQTKIVPEINYTADEHREIVAQYARRLAYCQSLITRLTDQLPVTTVEVLERLAFYDTLPSIDDLEVKNLKRGEYVYVIQQTSLGTSYKIGMTTAPRRRLVDFRVNLPFTFELRALMRVSNARATERMLHVLFHDKREDGEWFALTPDDFPDMLYLSDAIEAWVTPPARLTSQNVRASVGG